MRAKLELIISALILTALLISLEAGTTVEAWVAPTPYPTYHAGAPYTTIYYPTEVPPPNGTKMPTVAITYPVNSTVTASNNLTLTANLMLETSTSYYPITLGTVCYKPSWEPNNVTIDINSPSPFTKKTIPLNINITNIPEGPQSITVYAYTVCQYETGRENVRAPVSQSGFIVGNFLYIYSNFYRVAGSSTVNFTIDTTPTKPPTPTPSPTPNNNTCSDYGTNTLLYAAGITALVVAAVIVGMFVYFKKRQKQ